MQIESLYLSLLLIFELFILIVFLYFQIDLILFLDIKIFLFNGIDIIKNVLYFCYEYMFIYRNIQEKDFCVL